MGIKNYFSSFVSVVDKGSSRADSIIVDASQSSKRDPIKALAKKIGLSLGGTSRDFQPPEVDFTVIEKAYETEAYVRQGVDKYIDKMFKAGWCFTGKNPTTVEYIKLRFAYMADVTQMPTEKLFIEYCEDIVKFSNSILAKSRMTDQAQLPPGVTVQGVADSEPVVGYFPLNISTMLVKRDKFGTIKQWEQQVAGQDKPVKFKPEDIVHTWYKRKKGNAFGTPFLLPVLDDIRALRQAEDNVLKMLYRNVSPFYHIKVGSEEYPSDDIEIDAAKAEIDNMTLEGGIVTSERWSINAIAADKVIDSSPHVKYFEDRVFSGIGVPATMYGRGATANKSTSDNMSSEFIDRVKAFQKIGEIDIDEFMIKELLMEGGFDPVLNPDDMVYFIFNEIDVDMKVKLENHYIYKYEHMSITEDEMRQLLGLDPITDRSKMYTALVDKEKAQYAEMFKPTPTSSTGTKPASSDKGKGTPSTNNKVKPKNQHVKKDDVSVLFSEHLQELNDEVILSLHEFYNGNKVALNIIANKIKLKQEIFETVMLSSFDGEEFDKINNAHNMLFRQLSEYIYEAIAENKSITDAIEIINSIFNVIIVNSDYAIKSYTYIKEV